mmetsp:Transcript_1341/g.4128  ORF Transcript_1341/g.4128 Transcript_1341/m.4128 type:complete len:347 (+) Transcript_1341:2241-3281(+)
MAVGTEPHQQLVQQTQLPAALHQRQVSIAHHRLLGIREEIRVVAALLQLHDRVHERGARAVHALVQLVKVARQYPAVVAPLHRRHAHAQDALRLRRQALLHVLLEAAQQQWLQLGVQLADLLLALQVIVALQKVLHRAEAVRHQKGEQTPQLLESVLERCARDQEAVGRVKAAQRLVQRAVHVLEAVRLVHGQVVPAQSTEHAAVPQQDLVGGDQHVHARRHASHAAAQQRAVVLAAVEFVLAHHRAALRVPRVHHRVESRRPPVKLLLPLRHGRERNHHQEGTLQVVLVKQVAEQGHGLDRLAQTHLVGQDAVVVLRPQVRHPVETMQLVVTQTKCTLLGATRAR